MIVQEHKSIAGSTVVISNGHGKFHLIYAAQGAEQHGMLERLITGAYPTPVIKYFLAPIVRLTNNRRLQRWLTREVEGVPANKIYPCTLSEPFNQLSVQFPRYGCNGSGRLQLDALSFRIYQNSAMRVLLSSNATVYHCRAGDGGKTIGIARGRGMKIFVDHSIAHPQALMQLMDGGTYNTAKRTSLPPLWQMVQDDIDAADYVVVNSDFVKKTMMDFGCLAEKIIVQYWGVDIEIESYLRTLQRSKKSGGRSIKFLFAGGVGIRKGANLLLDVFERLDATGWSLTLAGGIEPELRHRIECLRHPAINVMGTVQRSELLKLMIEHDIFIFPTLAEGSARVVFEAMAAGMAIITTPNAGSVVRHTIDGLLVPAGDTDTLRAAIIQLMEKPENIEQMGINGRRLVVEEYNSNIYKEKIIQMYSNRGN